MGAYSRSVERGDKANAPDIGTVGSTGVKIRTFAKESRAIKLLNPHASQTLSYSLDGGTTYQTVGPHGKLDEALHGPSVTLKGSAAGTNYELNTTEAQ